MGLVRLRNRCTDYAAAARIETSACRRKHRLPEQTGSESGQKLLFLGRELLVGDDSLLFKIGQIT